MKVLTFLAMCGLVVAQSHRYPYGNTDYTGLSPDQPHRKIGEPRISIKLAKAISAATSIDEFLDLVTDGGNGSKGFGAADRFDGLERSIGILARPAPCIPNPQPVRVADEIPYQPGSFYFPTCVQINRCGGCCSAMLICQPKKTIIKNFEFIVSTITTSGKIIPNERKIIPLVEHVECECNCRIKDCPAKAKYYEDDCECICQNVEDQNKCEKDYPVKEWDYTTCSCHCREDTICSSGTTFNLKTCRCEFDPTPTQVVETRREFPGFDDWERSRGQRRGNKDDPVY